MKRPVAGGLQGIVSWSPQRITHEVARHRFRGAVVARGLAEPCDTNNIIIAASHFIGGKGEVGEEMVRPRPLY